MVHTLFLTETFGAWFWVLFQLHLQKWSCQSFHSLTFPHALIPLLLWLVLHQPQSFLDCLLLSPPSIVNFIHSPGFGDHLLLMALKPVCLQP